MWVKVDSAGEKKELRGRLDNDSQVVDMECGDVIEFDRGEIERIYETQ